MIKKKKKLLSRTRSYNGNVGRAMIFRSDSSDSELWYFINNLVSRIRTVRSCPEIEAATDLDFAGNAKRSRGTIPSGVHFREARSKLLHLR